MLTGPGLTPADIEDRLEIDPDLTTQLTSICECFRDDFKETPKTLTEEDCARLTQKMTYHALAHGEKLRVRDDGIAFYAVTAPDDQSWVIGQIAIAHTDGCAPAFAGIYYHTSLYVSETHRGKGIGSDLVVEHVLHNGGVLNWDLDSCGYSPGGAAAHIRAFAKIEAIAAEPSTPQPGDTSCS